jgi:Tfp pilus assembly protein PilZ
VPKVFLIAALLGSALLSVPQGDSGRGQEKTGVASAVGAAVKVTITTGGGLYGPLKNQYKVGEDIPVVISLTNTTDQPQTYCLSTSVFQNRPQLKKEGQLIPYATDVLKVAETEEYVRRCEANAARQFYELQPKQTRAIDWFTLSRGVNWYGNLPPGHYELSLRRRIVCCQGPFLESDKVSFDVVP